jgi:hypothetical protein
MYDHDLCVRFVDGDGELITLGRAWLGRCEGTAGYMIAAIYATNSAALI